MAISVVMVYVKRSSLLVYLAVTGDSGAIEEVSQPTPWL
jgi:hypothetical protein